MICYFDSLGDCDGQLIRAHLIRRSLLKQRYPFGVVNDTGGWRRLGRGEDRYDLAYRSLKDLVDDPRSWVACCGGGSGLAGHHGRLDGGWLRVPAEQLPAGFREFCAELGLEWYVERNYP